MNASTTTSPSSSAAAEAVEAVLQFDHVAMLPQDGDSAAVAKRLLPKNSCIALVDEDDNNNNNNNNISTITLKAPCLEGHRFLVRPVSKGEPLLSWGLPFGHANYNLSPGDVLINEKVATALRGRLCGPHEETKAIQELLLLNNNNNNTSSSSPVNFVDLDVTPDSPFRIEEHGYTAVGTNETCFGGGKEEEEEENNIYNTFLGYRRSHGRGVGTRNYVAVIALTASAAPCIVPFKSRWKHYDNNSNNFDGVCIVAHSEGESSSNVQHNIKHIHRCIAGFVKHMNLGAVVIVTTGRERHITRDTLCNYVTECNNSSSKTKCKPVYPPECFEPPFCQYVQVHGKDSNNTEQLLDEAVHKAVSYATDGVQREPCPLSNLCIALQCGGSDSFSGLTGNPLAGDVAARLICEYAGGAILAESPELVGAEPYVLSRVASEGVAKDFICTTENYKAFGARHGLSVAGNPSGGNLYRGLYNIVLKSLGAARKKPPSIVLDAVLEYGEPMCTRPGNPRYAFMDSPGNDLESIAGQVASGSNIIFFITGNGAMTNFPFVPTIKFVTTSKRYQLLQHEMDIDSEPYGHGGEDRSKAVSDGFDLCVRIASGKRSKGEVTGHSQVSLWRNWAVGMDSKHQDFKDLTGYLPGKSGSDKIQLFSTGDPHQVRPDPLQLPDSFLQEKPIRRVQEGFYDDPGTALRPWLSGASFALIPTSLCSSAIAVSIMDHMKEKYGDSINIVCPSHTEGCGAAGDMVYEHRYQRLILGHALHPSVGRALFLEHGCEKTHNDYFRNCLKEACVLAMDDEDSGLGSVFGFCSLQGGGGIENATRTVTEHFCGSHQRRESIERMIIPWSSRPVAVGFLVNLATASSYGSLLAPKLGLIVRFLSQLHVHTVVPVNSPLISVTDHPAPVREKKPPNVNGDIEDYFSPGAPKAVTSNMQKQQTHLDQSIRSLFAVEALADATIPCPTPSLCPTLLPGQMIGQVEEDTVGGLHVMEIPRGASWDETVSCISPACDMMLLVAGAEEMSSLPGPCLSPTLRRAIPTDDDDEMWHQWELDTCTELVKVLRSPLVSGMDSPGPETVASRQKSLFSVTTFTVPRGHAVSF